MEYNTSWTRGSLSTQAKQIVVAIDHGLSFPDISGLECPVQTLRKFIGLNEVQGLIASPGIYRIAQSQNLDLSKLNRLITVDWCAVNAKGELTHRELFVNPDEAAQYSPDCFKMFFNVYPDKTDLFKNIRDLSIMAAASKRLGISCLAEIMLWNNDTQGSYKKQVSLLYSGCRIALEAGADCLKVPFIGSSELMNEIIDKIELPTFILGGSKSNDDEAFNNGIKDMADMNICGLMFGRNLWQSSDLINRIRTIRKILN